MSRRTVVWLVPVLLTFHNAEEAFAFRSYMPRMGALLPEPFATFEASLSYSTMLAALTVLSVLAFLVAVGVSARPQSRGMLWVLLVLEAAVAVNVIAHLIGAVAIFHGYGPGLATAVFINAPFAIYAFRRARREQWLSVSALRSTLPAALVLHGPVLLGGLWLASLASR
ncbi:MAG: hypothetical protein QOH22_2079 [Gemmatimonadaceae bacterium]|nr:hypothetical protein [Gemmatimonadaceae bacterium]